MKKMQLVKNRKFVTIFLRLGIKTLELFLVIMLIKHLRRSSGFFSPLVLHKLRKNLLPYEQLDW